MGSRDNSVGKAARLRTVRLRNCDWIRYVGKEIRLFSEALRPALGPTKPPGSTHSSAFPSGAGPSTAGLDPGEKKNSGSSARADRLKKFARDFY